MPEIGDSERFIRPARRVQGFLRVGHWSTILEGYSAVHAGINEPNRAG